QKYRGDALPGRRHQHMAIVGVDSREVDMRTGATLGIGGGRHTERLVAVLINSAWRAVTCAIEGAGNGFARAKRLTEALALSGHQPVAWRESELRDEALAERVGRRADLACHLAQ